jgi:hypothetical protein
MAAIDLIWYWNTWHSWWHLPRSLSLPSIGILPRLARLELASYGCLASRVAVDKGPHPSLSSGEPDKDLPVLDWLDNQATPIFFLPSLSYNGNMDNCRITPPPDVFCLCSRDHTQDSSIQKRVCRVLEMMRIDAACLTVDALLPAFLLIPVCNRPARGFVYRQHINP